MTFQQKKDMFSGKLTSTPPNRESITKEKKQPAVKKDTPKEIKTPTNFNATIKAIQSNLEFYVQQRLLSGSGNINNTTKTNTNSNNTKDNKFESNINNNIIDNGSVSDSLQKTNQSNDKEEIIIDGWLEMAKFEESKKEKLEKEENIDNFDEEKYKNEKYSLENLDSGKKFFKLRYIKKKIAGLSNEEKESQKLKFSSEFLLTVEKSILSFNLKNYKESYEFLLSSEIIKNAGEFGKFLLVVSGFDKFLIGEFLTKQKFPNDKKEVLSEFIECIKMEIEEIAFLDCLRFLFSRLNLPKDANLILEIMDKFSVTYFEINEKENAFVKCFKNSDNIYLLVSTILALNTMFTRKDIKIKNVIKKEEFVKMNANISKDFIEKLYDEIKKNPISFSDDYREGMYKNFARLVKEKDNQENENDNLKKCCTVATPNNLIIDNENNNEQNENNTIEETDEGADNFADQRKSLENKEYILKSNFQNFSDEDKKILKTTHKFIKISATKSSQKEIYISDDLTKLYYDKNKKNFLKISDIIDVYNGVNHNHADVIQKFIKNNSTEKQLTNYFITILNKNDKDTLYLKFENLESGMLWFKAMKSLVLQNGYQDTKSKDEVIKFEEGGKKLMIKIWEIIFKKWEIYGKFMLSKLTDRENIFSNLVKENKHYPFKALTIDKKDISIRNINKYLEYTDEKLSKNKDIDLNDFILLSHLGIPNEIRKKLWSIFIGNPCGLIIDFYDNIKKQINKFDFEKVDISSFNPNNNNTYSKDNLSNKIIIEILKIKDDFFNEKNKVIDNQNIIMTTTYNIARSIFTLRSDLPFNKSIIPIILLFLMIGESEKKVFSEVINLLCSNSYYLKIYMGDQDAIKKTQTLFDSLLNDNVKKISEHFKKLEISSQLYIIQWFENLFTTTFNLEISSYVLDLLLLDGEYILYVVGITVIKILEEELLNLPISEIFNVLKKFPDKYDLPNFIMNVKYFNPIRDDFVKYQLKNDLEMQKSKINE